MNKTSGKEEKTMNFAEAAKMNAAFTTTENGAVALNTTGDARLDLFGTIGSLRLAEKERITRLFAQAWKADPLFATKIVFYARDVRGGLGERQTFRTILQYMAEYHPEALRPNLDLIGVYGRYDDLYCLIGTPLENEMWAAMKKQFEEDRQNLQNGNAISLPFALNFGWGGELNLEYIFEKLFSEPFGGGYPKERVVPEQRNKKILDGVRAAAFRPLADILNDLDPELVKGAFAGKNFDEYFFRDCKDEALAELVKKLKG